MKSVEIKLGTRESKLAWSQSQWVAQQIESKNENLKVKLVGIKTQGDLIQNIPLSQVEGKDFFTKELDLALLRGDVDLTVHSFKDLSLDRPNEFCVAAVPSRENPRDILICSEKIDQRIKDNKKIIIGTSSLRRVENVPELLSSILPHHPNIELTNIRGNIDSRMDRLFLNETHERYCDGIILAHAGVKRLFDNLNEQLMLREKFKKFKFMLLPISENPTAPAQGALAIECRKNDIEIYNAIRKIHDPLTESIINEERKILRHYGGGCHQRFGVTQFDMSSLGVVQIMKGKSLKGESLDQYFWSKKPIRGEENIVSLDPSDALEKEVTSNSSEIKKAIDLLVNAKNKKVVFVAHSNAIENLSVDIFKVHRVYVSGLKSWRKLASRGIWVEGCAEGFGFEFIRNDIFSKMLSHNIDGLEKCVVLTHSGATADWSGDEFVVCAPYTLSLRIKNKNYLTITDVYISSLLEFDTLKTYVSETVRYACGPGKTARKLNEKGIKNIQIFPSKQEWKKWIKGE